MTAAVAAWLLYTVHTAAILSFLWVGVLTCRLACDKSFAAVAHSLPCQLSRWCGLMVCALCFVCVPCKHTVGSLCDSSGVCVIQVAHWLVFWDVDFYCPWLCLCCKGRCTGAGTQQHLEVPAPG